jgi:Spy/CpxP family protein refolding chaperone
MFTKFARAAVIALAMMMPVAMNAQQGRVGGRGGRMGPGGNPVAPLIDMRRELNLSARQLTQLDSIERTLVQRNESLRDRMRTRLDSIRPRTRQSGEAEIQRFRAESDSVRALRQLMSRNDSTARVAAMNVLSDSQRAHVSERMAERRGFERGRMSTMRSGGGRALRGRQGQQGFGPRMRRGQGGGGRGMMGPEFRPRGGMRGPGGFGPRGLDNRGMPDAPMGRFRRPPGDISPDSQTVAPRRGQPGDSLRFERRRRPPAGGER